MKAWNIWPFSYRGWRKQNSTVYCFHGFFWERVSWICVLWEVCPWIYNVAVEGSRMIMDGAGGLGRGGKFSKAKGKKGLLQNQSLTEPCRLASIPLP